jgi:hypothetical protein
MSQCGLFIVVTFFIASSVPSIYAQEHPVTITILRCDRGKTTIKQEVYPQGSLMTITSESGNKYFVLKIGNSYTFAFQPSHSSMPRGIAMSSWMQRVAKESPNAYRFYERQQNDCVEEKR